MAKGVLMRQRYRVKKKKSLLKNRFFWLALVLVSLASAIFYLVFLWPFLEIKEIKVEGSQKVPAEEIQQVINSRLEKGIFFLKTRSILVADLKSLEKLLSEEFPPIETAQIKKEFPDRLVARVRERQALGIWCQDNTCFSLDKNGVIFESREAPEAQTTLLIKSKQSAVEIFLGETVIEKEILEKILFIRKTLAEKAGLQTAEFALFEDELRLDVKTAEGWKIFFDLKEDLNWPLVRLELLLEKELTPEKRPGLEYIDLRFSKVYYK